MANPRYDAKSGYHTFGKGNPHSFEVIWLDASDLEPGSEYEPGWYWAAGEQGYLFDGEPCGPFNSSTAAYKDARNF